MIVERILREKYLALNIKVETWESTGEGPFIKDVRSKKKGVN